MNKVAYITEIINFEVPDPIVTHLTIQIFKEYVDGFEMVKTYIKFAFVAGQFGMVTDEWFVIDSINPIRVFDGGAIFSSYMPHYIRTEEYGGTSREELIELVSSWTLGDLFAFKNEAIKIGLNDQHKLFSLP